MFSLSKKRWKWLKVGKPMLEGETLTLIVMIQFTWKNTNEGYNDIWKEMESESPLCSPVWILRWIGKVASELDS